MRHLPHDECGSSDALGVYADGSGFCWSCKKYVKDVDKEEVLQEEQREGLPLEEYKVQAHVVPEKDQRSYDLAELPQVAAKRVLPINGDFRALADRGISLETAKKYQVFKHPDSFYSWAYPQFTKGEHVANKFRRSGDVKGFSVDGEFNKSELFGQWLFEPGSAKAITVTEGYDDAMAAFEMQGSKYPCVSVHSASTARRDCAKSFEFLNSFNEIILCFDKDEAKIQPDGTSSFPGQDAAKEVAKLFPAKKVRIVTLQRAKDANDYLKQGLKVEFGKEWWSAPVFTPDGLVLGTELWNDVSSEDSTESIEYPFPGLNEKTYGMRLGEMVIITADTGVGKTSLLKEIEYYILNHTAYGLGILHLEETKKATGLGLMSIEANLPLHLPDVREKVSQEELKEYFNKTVNSDRIVLYDHFGSNEINDLLSKIRHMAAMGCKFIVLDHLSIVVSDQQNGDERKLLDEIATKLKVLTIELNICVIAVIHQNRSGQIRGTAGVEQLANIVIKMYRDKEADDPWRANITKLTIQKNRFCGRTGPACYLEYAPETGRLQELDKAGIVQYESGKQEMEQPPW